VFESPDEDHLLDIAVDEANHRYLLVGERRFQSQPVHDAVIVGREVSLDGQLLGHEEQIALENATTPAVAAGHAGRYLVVFADRPSPGTQEIFGQLWGLHRVLLPIVMR
jgi:hypothetical protein